MQNRQPPPLPASKVNLFTPGGNKKGKGRPAPTSMTEASRAHPAPTMRPQPPPPPPPLPPTAISASGSGSGSALSPQSHRTPSIHHAGPPPPPPPPRPLSSLVATPDIRKQVTTAMKLLATITRDQQDRDYLEKAYDWPDLGEDEREALNANLAQARQAEMAQRDKAIEATYSRLSNDMVALFTGLVEHATSSRVDALVRRCDAQQKRIDDLEAQQRGASSTATTTTIVTTTGNTSADAAAQQKRIDDLERKLNTLLQAQAQQTTTSSSSPRPAAPLSRPQTYSPAASPPGTPCDPTSAPPDLHATVLHLRDKYRTVGHEVVSHKARIEKLNASVAELQKKLAQLQSSEDEAGTGGGGEVVKGLERRLEKVEQALGATTQQHGAGGAVGATTSTGGSTMDPRRRPSSTTPSASDAQVSQLGKKRSHEGVDGADSGADHPHKAPKPTEGATPASLAAMSAAAAAAGADADDGEKQQQLKERLQKVEERLGGCEEKVTALRSDVDKGLSRIDATVVNFADLEKKEKERTERQERTAAAPSTLKGGSGGSSTSDMDLDKSDEDDKERAANAEKFDVLERRIRQMEASGSPELLIEPVKNEVAELRKLFDEDPKNILAFIRNIEQALARSSAFTNPVVEALRSFVGTAADGSALPADQVRGRLLDTLIRMRDDLQRHGTTLASHDQSIKSLVKANEETDAKFEALEDLGSFLGEALPQLHDLYLLVRRAQQMNLFPKTATLFPNENANANANSLAIANNGSHQSPTPGASMTGTASAAPNGIVNGASGSGGGGSGAKPPPQPNGIVGAPPPPPTTTTAATSASTATTGANALAQGRPSAPPATPSTSTPTSANPSSLPQRPPPPQGQQRPKSANGSAKGATPRTVLNSLPPRPQ